MATFAPHVQAGVTEINRRFPKLGKGGTYPGHGEDPPGEAYAADFWTESKAVHDEVFTWLQANARRLGLKYVISWERIWSVERADEGVRPYLRYGEHPEDPSKGHRNHIHTSWEAEPPPATEQPPTLGVPIMANDPTDIWINYHADQPLLVPGQLNTVSIAADAASVVIGSSIGIDVTAVIEFGGLKPGEWADICWRRVWKKAGSTSVIKPPDYLARPGIPYRGGGLSAEVTLKDNLPKATDGYTACLRLMASTNGAEVFIARRQIEGWWIKP